MKEYTVSVETAESFDIEDVIDEFEVNGFNVTKEAIMHNFNAWKDDCKSGYKDEINGYFLFTPCGCNALRFDALELTGADWQKTYVA